MELLPKGTQPVFPSFLEVFQRCEIPDEGLDLGRIFLLVGKFVPGQQLFGCWLGFFQTPLLLLFAQHVNPAVLASPFSKWWVGFQTVWAYPDRKGRGVHKR